MPATIPSRVRARLAAVLALLPVPLVALAQEAPPPPPALPEDPPGSLWMSWAATGALLGTLLVAVALVNRFAPERRHLARRGLFLVVFFLLGQGWHLVARLAGFDDHVRPVEIATALAGSAVIVTLALMLVHAGLAILRQQAPTIVLELAAGGAYFGAILYTLRGAGMDPSGLLTTSAVVTGILALSLQATLGNVLGGIALQIDESIHVGDWIELNAPQRIQGRVRQIRWRHTVIETRNWDTLIVPNSNLLAANFLILGKREGQPLQTRRSVFFNVDLKTPPETVIRAADAALTQQPIPGVAATPPPFCILLDMAAQGRDHHGHYVARYWLVDIARDDGTDSLVRARLYAAFQREGIRFATTFGRLTIENEDGDARERRDEKEIGRRLKVLANVEFLKPLTDEEKREVAGGLRRTPFANGEIMARQGDVAHDLFIMASGTAEVRVDINGEVKTVATLKAPTFFGEMGLMTGEPRTATVVATTPAETYRLDKDTFHRVLRERPQVANEISMILAQRRMELQAFRDNAGSPDKGRVQEEGSRLLSRIQSFFGLNQGRP